MVSGVWRRIAHPVTRRFKAWRALQQARQLSRERIAVIQPRRVLVLCYGNIYRSPFVAAALSQAAPPGVEIRSAGFHSRTGRASPSAFQELSERYGINLRAHRSNAIDAAVIQWADLIVLMDRHNWDRISESWPGALPKVVWLGAFLENGSVEMVDPYGRSGTETEIIIERLHLASQALLQRLTVPGVPSTTPRTQTVFPGA